MYQHTVVVGHLGKDPEMRYLPSGDPVVRFSVATTRKWTTRDGQPGEKTTWFSVDVFGRQAENCNQYLRKGSLVLVEGEIDARAYTAQDGTPRASLDLRARNVRFLGGRGESGGGGGGEDFDEFAQQGAPAKPQGQRPVGGNRGGGQRPPSDDLFPEKPEGGGDSIGEDDIPF